MVAICGTVRIHHILLARVITNQHSVDMRMHLRDLPGRHLLCQRLPATWPPLRLRLRGFRAVGFWAFAFRASGLGFSVLGVLRVLGFRASRQGRPHWEGWIWGLIFLVKAGVGLARFLFLCFAMATWVGFVNFWIIEPRLNPAQTHWTFHKHPDSKPCFEAQSYAFWNLLASAP